MASAERLSATIDDHGRYRLFVKPETDVVLFESIEAGTQQLLSALPAGLASLVSEANHSSDGALRIR
jgi:hypothetical protein